MSKHTLYKWGGVALFALLAALVFFGCKPAVEAGGEEKWEVLEKDYKFLFKDSNTSDKSRRGIKGFGNGLNLNKVSAAIIEVKAVRPKDGVAGGIFGLTENADKSLNFFVVGVKAVESGQAQYFLSWHKNVPQDQLDGESALPNEVKIVPNSSDVYTNLDGFTTAADGSLTFYLSFARNSSNDGFKAWITKNAPNWDDVKDGTLTEQGIDLKLATIDTGFTGTYEYQGQIAAYGTTFPGNVKATVSETTFTVRNAASGTTDIEPSKLSAE